MNLSDMRTDLRRKIGNPSVAEVADALLTSHINTAYRWVAGRYAFQELRKTVAVPTVASQNYVNIPAGVAAVLRLWDTTSMRKLRKAGVRMLASLPDNIVAGEPRWYVREGTKLTLVPTPDAVYSLTLYYLADITALAVDADVPVIAPSWHDGIVLKARHVYYDERGDVGKAIYASNAWKEWVADKPSEVDIEKTDMDDSRVILPELGGREYHMLGRRDPRFDERFDYE